MDTHNEVVTIGSTVQVTMNGMEKQFQIVDPTISNPANGMISVNTPVAQALLGKSAGAMLDIRLPSGVVNCQVLHIT